MYQVVIEDRVNLTAAGHRDWVCIQSVLNNHLFESVPPQAITFSLALLQYCDFLLSSDQLEFKGLNSTLIPLSDTLVLATYLLKLLLEPLLQVSVLSECILLLYL